MRLWSHAIALTALSSFAACSEDPPEPDPSDCVARDCSGLGFECGDVDDGKGGCFNCGACPAMTFCGGGGERNKCGCEPATCEARNANCGEIFDRCTGTMIPCGTCTAPNSCGGGGEDNVCGRVLVENQECTDPVARCGVGLMCCPTRGAPICQPASGGQCPAGLADLTVDPTVLPASLLIEEKTFTSTDCAVLDACVTVGRRKLLRFTTQTPNIGFADVSIGDPLVPPNNPEFSFSMCHAHYHYNGYMKQRLIRADGSEAAAGFKAAFCLEDAVRSLNDADVPRDKKYICGTTSAQGIQPGWADYYSATLDCQWIDITGVAAGDYELELHVNPDGRIPELRTDNNTARVSVTIP